MEVNVGIDNHRAFSTELQDHRRQMLRRKGHDDAPYLAVTCKCYTVNKRHLAMEGAHSIQASSIIAAGRTCVEDLVPLLFQQRGGLCDATLDDLDARAVHVLWQQLG